MVEVDDLVYSLFHSDAIRFGPDTAIQRIRAMMPALTDEVADAMVKRYRTGVESVLGVGGPVIAKGHETWYPGAQPSDPSWAKFVEYMEKEGRSDQVAEVHRASDTIIGLTPDPANDPRRAKGLVVGFVQSGKTTNFTAVAAKAADLDYRMVIVLAGIHNSLRKQTQERLEEVLFAGDEGSRWMAGTRIEQDFDLVKLNEDKRQGGKAFNAASMLSAQNKTLLLVVKKNHVVLRKLRDWLSADGAQAQLENNAVLVIDDEADQASVETRTINPLIREILQLMPRSTYIGYTATPFANVFINPFEADDLYPSDFIYPLPRPEGYFGPEKLFGRDVLDGTGDDFDGYDMIRIIPEEDEFLYRPRNRAEVPDFEPTVTDELQDAISWFCMATAARWHRRQSPKDHVDSSMLVHTSFQIEVHDKFQDVIQGEIRRLKTGIGRGDEKILNRMRQQWEIETERVKASDFGIKGERFDDVLSNLPSVLSDVRVIVENSGSDERLDYAKDKSNTIIAIGGNTLSRGITLKGLISSVFIRPTNTYDTLMQMGRWFGFRTGYEDLPRIWMTDQLRRSFRHLSLVEHEMRSDMEVYERQNLTPRDAAVRIRTHPSLRITAKMGAAVPARTSFSGARLQVREYERRNLEEIISNWEAGETLINDARRRTKGEEIDGGLLYRNVPVASVLEFLDSYVINAEQADMDAEMIKKYIQERLRSETPQLSHWNVAIRAGESGEKIFAGRKIKFVNRAPLIGSKGTLADIGTLMVPQDLVIDLPEISSSEARSKKEAGMKELRWKSEEVKDKGLLVLYPIDAHSKPKTGSPTREDMEAEHDILGLGLVFPRANYSESEKAKMQVTHQWVDLASVETSAPEVELAESPEIVDNTAEVYGES